MPDFQRLAINNQKKLFKIIGFGNQALGQKKAENLTWTAPEKQKCRTFVALPKEKETLSGYSDVSPA